MSNTKVKEVVLNKRELKKMLRFLDTKSDSTRVKLRFDASGIGDKITMFVDEDSVGIDVTDYLSW